MGDHLHSLLYLSPYLSEKDPRPELPIQKVNYLDPSLLLTSLIKGLRKCLYPPSVWSLTPQGPINTSTITLVGDPHSLFVVLLLLF